MQQSNRLKKSLTNEGHLQVLEIIGLSPRPLSSYEILKQCAHKYRRTTSKYVYEIIKDLYKPEYLGQPYAERFLKILYNKRAQKEIDFLENSYQLRSESGGIRSDLIDEPQARRVRQLENNPRNWTYDLNLKGFLLYLISVHENQLDNRKLREINKIVTNLSKRDMDIHNDREFTFLQYFDIFDEVVDPDYKVSILIEIAVELQFQLKTLTSEYLKNYVIRHLFYKVINRIAFDGDEVKNHFMFIGSKDKKVELKRQELERRNVRRLNDYKLRILNDLIPNEVQTLKSMIIDRMKTKKQLKVN